MSVALEFEQICSQQKSEFKRLTNIVCTGYWVLYHVVLANTIQTGGNGAFGGDCFQWGLTDLK